MKQNQKYAILTIDCFVSVFQKRIWLQNILYVALLMKAAKCFYAFKNILKPNYYKEYKTNWKLFYITFAKLNILHSVYWSGDFCHLLETFNIII